MKNTKVCHIITRMIIGGAQENTLFTVEGLAQKGYDVTLVSGSQTGPEGDLTYLIEEGAPYRFVVEPFLWRNIHPVFDVMAFVKLVYFFRKERFDIVHTHSSKAGILARWAAFTAQVPIIVHTIHGLPFHRYQNKWVNLIYRCCERISARATTKIITVADAMAREALKAHVASAVKFTTIYSGMDLVPFLRRDHDWVQIRKKYGLTGEDLVIGKVARLFHLKGHSYLLQAAVKVVQEFPRVKFLLVGDGILRNSFQTEIRKRGIEKNFIFTGLLRPKAIPEIISAMDIVVHVSLREGLAKVLAQAAASGKPVISFDLDGAKEVIENNVNGFLVPPCDEGALTEALLKLLRNPELCKTMGARGPQKVDPYFRKEYMVDRIDEFYQELLKINLHKSLVTKH